MSADPIRRRAWEILNFVDKGGALDGTLAEAMAAVGDDRDRRFLSELVRGALQWQGRYDHLIARFSRRGNVTRRAVSVVLRLGLHQLLACDRVPVYAAVDQSVRLAREVGGGKTASYVNGLLHAVARELAQGGGETTALRPLFPDPQRAPAAYLAAWHSHPRWLVERWLDRYGFAATEQLCDCNNRRAPLACHMLPPAAPATVAAGLAATGHAVQAGRLGERALVLERTPSRADLRAILAREPSLIVQDEAVQAAPSFLCADLHGPALDLCAAPGGKTLHLRTGLDDAEVLIAMDLDRARLALVADSAARTGLGPDALVTADGRNTPFADGDFATVLLDGPCSGTGVIRRHPEGRWRVGPDLLVRNASRLLDLAREAYRVTRPGGLLLYATCSLEPEENEGVVDKLREEYPGLVPASAEGKTAGAWRRTWLPHLDGADGFFAARLRRRETRV